MARAIGEIMGPGTYGIILAHRSSARLKEAFPAGATAKQGRRRYKARGSTFRKNISGNLVLQLTPGTAFSHTLQTVPPQTLGSSMLYKCF